MTATALQNVLSSNALKAYRRVTAADGVELFAVATRDRDGVYYVATIDLNSRTARDFVLIDGARIDAALEQRQRDELDKLDGGEPEGDDPAGPQGPAPAADDVDVAALLDTIKSSLATARTRDRNARLGHYTGRNGGGETDYLIGRAEDARAELERDAGLRRAAQGRDGVRFAEYRLTHDAIGTLWAEHRLAVRVSEARDAGQDRPELVARLNAVRAARRLRVAEAIAGHRPLADRPVPAAPSYPELAAAA